ncbi:glycosyl transferase, partial [Campylobacter sp. BCW_8712]
DIKENSLIEFSIEGNNEIYKVYKSSKFFKNKDELLNFQAPNIDYIIFLDSDDYWELNCIEECVSRMEGANVVWFDFQPEIENNFKKQFKTEMEVLDCKNEEIISTKDWLEICEKKKYLFWFAWQGMIEFKSLLRSKLKFIDKIIHEDHHFGICLFSSIEKIY